MEFRLRPWVSWIFLQTNNHQAYDDCCFVKISMKPRGHSLNSMNYIYIYIYIYICIIFIIYIYIYMHTQELSKYSLSHLIKRKLQQSLDQEKNFI